MAIEFLTDGVRAEYQTPEVGYSVGRAAVESLGIDNFVMVQDTRHFNPELAEAVTDGLASLGANVIDMGILPTPAAAITADRLTRSSGEPYGAFSLSASHNPATDFGIKVFGAGGVKLNDEETASLQHFANNSGEAVRNPNKTLTSRSYVERLRKEYIDYLVATRNPGLDSDFLLGTKLVIDAANGAAYWSAAEALRGLGADVQAINDNPLDEINKNSGATHPETIMAEATRTGRIGFAFDGDADRLLSVSETGKKLDGDHAIHIAMLGEYQLSTTFPLKAVSTRYSNFGLRRSLWDYDIRVKEVINGDRAVAEAMGSSIPVGGEHSGHTLFNTVAHRLERVMSGDGTVTAIQLLGYAAKLGRSLDDMAMPVSYPRIEKTLKGIAPDAFETELYLDVERKVVVEQGTEGDNLSRMSGTEKGVGRILVRDTDDDRAQWAIQVLEEAAR